jgi:hypothetical protein
MVDERSRGSSNNASRGFGWIAHFCSAIAAGTNQVGPYGIGHDVHVAHGLRSAPFANLLAAAEVFHFQASPAGQGHARVGSQS